MCSKTLQLGSHFLLTCSVNQRVRKLSRLMHIFSLLLTCLSNSENKRSTSNRNLKFQIGRVTTGHVPLGYSLVLNKRPPSPRLLIFGNFSRPPPPDLIWTPPLLINLEKFLFQQLQNIQKYTINKEYFY